ncbi:MAG: DUF2199 domain-containing protein [Betaproteobacteria bacterium]|nr:DUF2199 domain-containing protein [Betaproteobacteria bacterium]
MGHYGVQVPDRGCKYLPAISCVWAQWRLTLRSTGPAMACHLRASFHSGPAASCRRGPVSSNVGRLNMGFTCTTCGEYHDQLPMCFGTNAPALWLSMSEEERTSRGELTSDQCVVDDKHFFVLGRILLPVVDGPGPFAWLAWVSLSEKNFLRYCELWESEGREVEPPYFGWLQSALPYEPTTLSLKTRGDLGLSAICRGSRQG